MILPRVVSFGNGVQAPRNAQRNRFQRHKSMGEEDIDLYNLWKAKSEQEGCIFKAIRNSEMFCGERKETFVKFNYRTVENRSVDY